MPAPASARFIVVHRSAEFCATATTRNRRDEMLNRDFCLHVICGVLLFLVGFLFPYLIF
jgi:hypothetical protein